MGHIKYNEYKYSDIYWVGDIPSHWDCIAVKHHFFSKKQVAGNLADNYQRLALTLNGVIKRSKEDAEGLQPEKFETYQIVRKDSLIFKLIDLENIKTSRVGLSKWDGLVSPAYIVLSSNGDILPNYAENYFLNMWNEHIFNQLGSVGVRSNLNKEDVLNLPIIKPPLEEQKQIANYLDKKTAKIDEIIVKNKELIDLLDEKRVALINQVVTKGLNPDVRMKDSGVDWIGEMPEHWETVKLKFCTDIINEKKDFATVDDKYIGLEHIESETGRLISYSDEGADGTVNKFKKDMVLFGKLRPYLAKVIISPFDGVCSTELLIFKTKEILLPNYLFYVMLSNRFIEQVNSSTYGVKMPRASPEFINSLPIVIPNTIEQNEIINYLNNKTAKIDEIVSKIKENINLLEEYKTSLIHHVVTGKIDVKGEEI